MSNPPRHNLPALSHHSSRVGGGHPASTSITTVDCLHCAGYRLRVSLQPTLTLLRTMCIFSCTMGLPLPLESKLQQGFSGCQTQIGPVSRLSQSLTPSTLDEPLLIRIDKAFSLAIPSPDIPVHVMHEQKCEIHKAGNPFELRDYEYRSNASTTLRQGLKPSDRCQTCWHSSRKTSPQPVPGLPPWKTDRLCFHLKNPGQ